MSVLGNSPLLMTPEGYTISRNVRLRSSASAYFSRTPGSAGNRTTWTWSGWVKIGAIGQWEGIFNAGSSGNQFAMYLYTDYTIWVQDYNGSNQLLLNTTQLFRDPSAWYHVVLAIDTTQATAANRAKLYINGSQVTALTTATYPAQNYNTQVNSTSYQHNIGLNYQFATSNAKYFDGYLTEINFIDGQALTPSSFGQNDPVTGVWGPKKYGGTYGTNGFYLNFSDNSAATAAAIGKDSSGNGNNWTPNNISVTAGVTYDSMTDVPTLNSPTAANYCVINSLWYSGTATTPTLTNGNLDLANNSAASYKRWGSTMAVSSGKWYFEFTRTDAVGAGNYFAFGVTDASSALSTGVYSGNPTNSGASSVEWALTDRGYACNTSTYTNLTATLGTIGQNDVVQVCIDVDNKLIWFGKNNTFSGSPSAGTGAAFSNLASSIAPILYGNGGATTASANFGQRPFTYTPPTGFVALNTQNLPAPTIKAGNKWFDATLFTGTSSSPLAVTNSGSFAPDLVWVKRRSTTGDHYLGDTVRGVLKGLQSSTTNAEYSETANHGIISFDSGGFTLGLDTGSTSSTNSSGSTYAAWQWKKGATPGFDIVTYTGTGGLATVAHSLGVAPKMIIVMPRSFVSDKYVYHASIGAGNYVPLNLTSASASTTLWNSTAPTSSVFTVNGNGANQNGSTFVAYLFAEVAGFSKFGSYTGNGSADGPFVYLGFRPRFLLLKVSSTTGDWVIYDTSRNTYNVMDLYLYPDSSAAEAGSGTPRVDALSNGFKLRNTGQDNTSSATYIYAAFAENPFKYALAR